MRYLKFFAYQFLLFNALIALNFYFDESIHKPFSLIGILKTLITILLAMSAFGWMDKLKNRLESIRLRNKLLLSFLAFVSAFFFFGLLTGEIMF
ncbi:hypothetical protein [Domibacillus mangrovi]|uniref:Uncharacterized protein n=1 Tax=Domibacillus mangrovi TaxID=1714354 RepID=A0A1Q5P3T4_9BACI|nr:hypothetical protein [Domibacillus mangrovi]OKL36907.1 hypothetical protein BLL40_09335 [Domibacillus mangrovi]